VEAWSNARKRGIRYVPDSPSLSPLHHLISTTIPLSRPAHVRLATHSNGHKAACKILPALHRSGDSPATWDEILDAVEAHKEVVLLKALAGAGLRGIVGLEGVIEEGGWT
jgi:hypothetical protein